MATGCTFTVTDPHPPLPLLTLIAQAPICTFLIGRTPARISVRISFWEVGKPQLTWAAKQLTRQVLTRQAPPISTTKHPVFRIYVSACIAADLATCNTPNTWGAGKEVGTPTDAMPIVGLNSQDRNTRTAIRRDGL